MLTVRLVGSVKLNGTIHIFAQCCPNCEGNVWVWVDSTPGQVLDDGTKFPGLEHFTCRECGFQASFEGNTFLMESTDEAGAWFANRRKE